MGFRKACKLKQPSLDPDFNLKNLIYQNLKKRIKKNEGFSRKPYKDKLGFLTIGFGHVILSNEKHLLNKKTNKTELEKVFINDFNKALNDFNVFLKPLSSNTKESELLIEMVFQIGIERVLKFKKLLLNLTKGNKYLVCFEMMNSIQYKQTPHRVKNLITIFIKQ